ncbi:Uncharacterized protein pbN1_04680 [Aromatoleum bremense]|nr:Uncharacterized protein pbN1_04680 [Aromatoleum bremense]
MPAEVWQRGALCRLPCANVIVSAGRAKVAREWLLGKNASPHKNTACAVAIIEGAAGRSQPGTLHSKLNLAVRAAT